MKLSKARFTAALAMSCLVAIATLTTAGFNGGGNNQVGGVSIDPAGVVRTATVQENQELVNLLRQEVAVPRGDLAAPADLRMVSLAGLQEAIREVRKTGGRLPAEIRYLAGLTAVDYVWADKDHNDLILAGPAEPWTLSETGSVVGKETGAAILRLEDLVVALRNVENARAQGITCSIEPTAEGRQRLNAFLRRVNLRPGQSPVALEAGMKEAFGPQMIRLNGIPANSRYACTLVAADYQMKRLAMALVDSPVKGLPSYLQMSRNTAHTGTQNPRWWMECDYESLTRNEAGTLWKLSGQGVKTMTEQDAIAANGEAVASGNVDKIAQKWADSMTGNFEQLAKAMPVFGDLQNLMDLTVVSTLIVQEQLEDRSGLQLDVLRDQDALAPIAFDAPQTIAPECSFIKGRSGWVVTASGGVSVNAFQVVHDQRVDPALDEQLVSSIAGGSWWWNKTSN
ncbi:DUF1598 domain-containing protein [Roseiconus nitratireducens]|uniref:DUF1598 domain-containing protein n=1 Tax=Roseiconus nitratireducens TaxID=2605748 RepID=A0A5M6DIE6_9BACT|nr:DUF1598 domain-containing protein [Roseiconus nitratireducens]KAA5545982.1 DUF1598 domain-containing protein [Roseiconus nitratireducens]